MSQTTVTIYRYSGHPIDNPTAYLAELNKQMDELQERESIKDSDIHEKSLYIQNELTKWHDEYIQDHPITKEIPYPKTRKQMLNLCKQYGASIVFCVEDKGLVGYIMDIN